ncbi:MAG TPA: AMP-binding protein [Acidimicrobiia bacterium]|nr:AMP-binding protein [Acidimicrobiia bacterium]
MDVLHGLTFADVLREQRRSRPEQLAVVDGDFGRDVRLTYAELDDRTNQLANALAAAGVGHGDRILWLGQNSFRVVEALVAAAKLGAMFCPANWRQSADELAFVLGDVDAKVVIWQDEEIGATVRAARELAGSSALWLRHDADGGGSYEEFLTSASNADLAVGVDPSAALLLIYTAAFSGRPNGAMLSHTALITQGIVMGRLSDIDGDYVYLNCGPLFHIATFMTTLATCVAAGTNVFTRRVDAEELCRLIESERCTGAFIVGPTIKQILEANKDHRYDLKSLRAFRGKPEWNEMITVDTSPWARHPGGYGQTEVMGMLTFNTLAHSPIGTHGRPSPVVRVRIVDPDDRELPVGETGEIVARGPTVMNGYWNRPEENARRQRGGWHHTNDLGRREADGTITFIGPATRMIKSAAENIYPAEVEGCVAKHPAVAECAIIGVPDAQWTQSVKAIVVLNEGESATAEAIIDHCRAHIASYKKPRTIEFVEKLPRDGFAVDYRALDEQFGGGGYPGGRNRSA